MSRCTSTDHASNRVPSWSAGLRPGELAGVAWFAPDRRSALRHSMKFCDDKCKKSASTHRAGASSRIGRGRLISACILENSEFRRSIPGADQAQQHAVLAGALHRLTELVERCHEFAFHLCDEVARTKASLGRRARVRSPAKANGHRYERTGLNLRLRLCMRIRFIGSSCFGGKRSNYGGDV